MTVMHMTKNVGMPYEGKLHVRFDEGELKVKQRPAKESLLEISSLLYNSVKAYGTSSLIVRSLIFPCLLDR